MKRTRVWGVTKCHECHKPFREGEDIITRKTTSNAWRETSRGNFRSREVKWDARVHRECAERAEREFEEYRAEVRADREAAMAMYREAQQASRQAVE